MQQLSAYSAPFSLRSTVGLYKLHIVQCTKIEATMEIVFNAAIAPQISKCLVLHRFYSLKVKNGRNVSPVRSLSNRVLEGLEFG